MKDSFKHIQASVLSRLSMHATNLGVNPINLDALSDINQLPEGNHIGLSSLTVAQTSNGVGESVVAVLVAITRNDPNNMTLSTLVSTLYDDCKQENVWPLLNVDTGEELGFITMVEGAEVLSVNQHENGIVSQAVGFGGVAIVGESTPA